MKCFIKNVDASPLSRQVQMQKHDGARGMLAKASTFLSLLLLTGCMSRPPVRDNRVEIDPEVSVMMPMPAELGYNLTASQLVTVEYDGETHQLPVQIEVDGNRVVLAGFSSWGQRIMSLTYENGKISTTVMKGLGQELPEPEQVLFNVMLSLWPSTAWKTPLEGIGWQLNEKVKKRELINHDQETVVTITYVTEPYLDGAIRLMNHQLNLKVTIKTLNYSK